MIWESGPWKAQLAKLVQRFQNALVLTEITAETDIQFEQDCFLSAYIIWKLLHSYKLTDEAENELYTVSWYPYVQPETYSFPLGLNNHHQWNHFYALGQSQQERRKIDYICDQLRHSYIFSPAINEDGKGYNGFFFNSDRSKDKRIHFIELQVFLNMIQGIAEDEMLAGRQWVEPTSGQWVQASSRYPLEAVKP